MRRETAEAAQEAVLSLPANYREVLVLINLMEMDHSEAAAKLDCAVGTVRSRLYRARQLLYRRLLGTLRAKTVNIG